MKKTQPAFRASNVRLLLTTFLFAATLFAHGATNAETQKAVTITYQGYPDCILLSNDTTRVVLCPEAGGRVLEYSLAGRNALYLEEEATGKPYVRGEKASMSAGRFDIGPEKLIPKRDVLWSGRWTGEIIDAGIAKLTSQKDKATGVQLTREFKLADKGSELTCTQTIHNVSDEEKQWCHWSRTFAAGKGIVVIPLTRHSRFPKNYVMYTNGNNININPDDENIRQRDGFLEVLSAPQFPKLGMDSMAGWFAYAAPNDLLFVKRYKTFDDRLYNEAAGLTISIWYPGHMNAVELEPIGPREILKPGESGAFTETWELFEFEFPKEGTDIDLNRVEELSGKKE